MSAMTITKQNFEAEVLNASQTVLLDFWASWCGPCQMLSPVVEEIAETHPNLRVGKVNVDQEPELARQFEISSIPTLLVFRNGKLVQRAVGVRPKAAILALLTD